MAVEDCQVLDNGSTAGKEEQEPLTPVSCDFQEACDEAEAAVVDETTAPQEAKGAENEEVDTAEETTAPQEAKGAKNEEEAQLEKAESEKPVEESESKTEEEKAPEMVRVLPVQATLPQDLTFTAPQNATVGQIICVRGPHGPLHVQLPVEAKPGQKCTVRLAAPWQHQVVVPKGAKPGSRVTFHGPKNEQLEAVVPQGKRPGETFNVSPPVVMLPVPLGALPGDHLSFVTPKGQQMNAPIPKDVGPGQYFAVPY